MRSRTTALAVLASVSLLALGGCGKPRIIPRVASGVRLASITVTSPSFSDGSRIPVDHTCDGKDLMPELVLSSPPENTRSLLLLVEDPDAPNGTFTHMALFNVSPDVRKLPGGAEPTGAGEAARFGLNDFQVAHYSGPCPPRGEAHRYRFRVVALDNVLDLPEGAPIARIEEAIDGHIIGEGMLTGHFGH
ncbi:MAG: YbhB/YbcL family Raf kinase inhibitor-like protein [Labilithrix sp.]|nr:YbhB/YbcL family Raf kinase inhibitor-like protein [Labilithrix sp.]MBX3221810.1 YbhB/YbcL family Raf kinase inhibitor-like protein [Labilithrix sp.]